MTHVLLSLRERCSHQAFWCVQVFSSPHPEWTKRRSTSPHLVPADRYSCGRRSSRVQHLDHFVSTTREVNVSVIRAPLCSSMHAQSKYTSSGWSFLGQTAPPKRTTEKRSWENEMDLCSSHFDNTVDTKKAPHTSCQTDIGSGHAKSWMTVVDRSQMMCSAMQKLIVM